MPTSSTSAAGTAAHQPRLRSRRIPEPRRDRRRHRERQGEQRRIRHDHQHVLPQRLDAAGPVAAEVHPGGKAGARSPFWISMPRKLMPGRQTAAAASTAVRRSSGGSRSGTPRNAMYAIEQQPELHAVSTRVEAAVSAATTERPGQRVAPKQVELEEVAPEIVADPLRADHERERGPGRRQPAGDLGHRPVALERERARGHRADDERHGHVPCAPRAHDGEQVLPEERAAPASRPAPGESSGGRRRCARLGSAGARRRADTWRARSREASAAASSNAVSARITHT